MHQRGVRVSTLRRHVVRELLLRSEMRAIILERWAVTTSAKDRIQASVLAAYLAERMTREVSNDWRNRCRNAAAFAGFKRRCKTDGRYWILCIKERA